MPAEVSIRRGADRFVSFVARLITRALFRSVEVVGFDDLPAGPRLIVANHFNGFVDPVVLAGALGRLPRFVAKGTLWKTPGVPVLMKLVGVLPVHRTVDGGGDNAGTFTSVVAELHDGHAVAIFPEGTTHDDQHLAPVRTGAARLALDAANDGVDLAIIPVGITFEDKVALRSRVVVRAAAPIAPAGPTYLDGAGAPVGSEDHDAVRRLTDEIRSSLAGVSPDFDSLLDAVELRAAADLLLRSEPDVGPLEEVSLAGREALASELADLPEDRRGQIGAAAAEHHLLLGALGVRDDHLVPRVGPSTLVRRFALTALLVVLLTPFALMGAVVNAIPAVLVVLAGTLATAPVSKGTNRVLAGVVAFPTAWTLLAVGDIGSGPAAKAFGVATSPLSPIIGALFDDRGGWGPSLLVFVTAPIFGLLAVWLAEQVIGCYRLAMTLWSNTQRRGQIRTLLEHRATAVERIDAARRAG